VERDRQLSQLLKTELLAHQISNVTILEEDILDLAVKEVVPQIDRKLMVIGNLPYNISSQVLIMLIHNRNAISRAIFMFQKELAQRLTADPGNKAYGRITVMLRYCSDVRILATVKAAQFFPPPKVDSQVLEIRLKTRETYSNPEDEKMLFRVIKAAFGNRRKTLKNSLVASGLQIRPKDALKALTMADIDPSRRAETLVVKEFMALEQSLRSVMREAD
jgi:16S rRNA (adenine1518-N6/adenine1519-N6)-dimethyltransferase